MGFINPAHRCLKWVKPEDVNEDEMILFARDIAKKIEGELKYPVQIKVHLIRETKAIDYAK